MKIRKSYVCQDCGKSCSNGAGLSAHRRKAHATIKVQANVQTYTTANNGSVALTVRRVKELAKEMGGMKMLRELVAELV